MLRLVTECRRQGLPLRTLDELDAQAEALVARYLSARVAEGKSAWTLKMERSAFRLFFGRPDLAADVSLPARRRTDITRSRRPAARDQDFTPEHWRGLLTFLNATGLRRSEAQRIRVRDVCHDAQGTLQVYVIGKGGRRRLVPVLPTYTEAIERLLGGRRPEERLFPRVPSHLDVHAHRRGFAQATYLEASGGQPLPPPHTRLAPGTIDADAARHTSQALGHNRLDVTTTHYLR